jgi:ATP/maltotriose-dependent transcriptional regulator MalT
MSPHEKSDVRRHAAMALLAQGKKLEALKELDAREAEAKTASPYHYAWAPLDRAFVLIETGEPAKAIGLLDEGLKRADALGAPAGTTAVLRAQAWGLKVRAEAALKKSADAEKSLAALDAVGRASSDDPYVQSAVHAARAELSLAKGDANAAAAELALCVPDDPIAVRTRIAALEKAGDEAGADAARQQLAKPVRHPMYLVARAKLARSTAPAKRGE